MIKRYLLITVRFALAIFFIIAAHSKITNAADFAAAIRAYDIIPAAISPIPAIFLPWIELYSGVFLLIGLYTRSASLIITILMSAFTLFILTAILRGLEIDCGCGASIAGLHKVGWLKIIENSVIILLSILIFKTNSYFFSVDSLLLKK